MTSRAALLPRLLLVSDRAAARARPLVELIAAVCDALNGDLLIQLREKELPDAELRALVAQLRDALNDRAPIVINDRPQIARELGLGLHLPAAAASVDERPPLFGRSVHNPAEARRAIRDGVDYAVVGTIFPTDSKPGHAGDGLAHLRALAEQLSPIPTYAIGGIDAANAASAIAAGAHGVAVRSAILGADDPLAAARAIADAIADSLRT